MLGVVVVRHLAVVAVKRRRRERVIVFSVLEDGPSNGPRALQGGEMSPPVPALGLCIGQAFGERTPPPFWKRAFELLLTPVRTYTHWRWGGKEQQEEKPPQRASLGAGGGIGGLFVSAAPHSGDFLLRDNGGLNWPASVRMVGCWRFGRSVRSSAQP